MLLVWGRACAVVNVWLYVGTLEDMSLSAVQRVASASIRKHGDATASGITKVLAGLGNAGKCRNNILRDLQRALERDNVLYVPPTYLNIPVAKGRTRDWPIVAPHELFGKLLTHDIAGRVLKGTLDLVGFWNHFEEEPGFSGHPVVTDHGLRATTIPIRIHGDDGRWSGKERPILVLQWGGMHHTPHPYDCRLLACVIPGVLYRKVRKINRTLREIWKLLTWSFNLMFEGKYPTEPYAPHLIIVSTDHVGVHTLWCGVSSLLEFVYRHYWVLTPPVVRLGRHLLLGVQRMPASVSQAGCEPV